MSNLNGILVKQIEGKLSALDFIGSDDSTPKMKHDNGQDRSPAYSEGRRLYCRLRQGDLAIYAPILQINKPIAIGIEHVIAGRLAANGIEISLDVIRAALFVHTRRPAYLRQARKRNSKRHNIDCVEISPMRRDHRDAAVRMLEEIKKATRDKKARVAEKC